jgi:hypothetical protein
MKEITSSGFSLTPLQTAGLLQIDEKTLRKFTTAGEIPHRRIGKVVRYSPVVLTAWLGGRDLRSFPGEDLRSMEAVTSNSIKTEA